MSYISQYIQSINSSDRKIFTTFLTTGFPEKEKFVETAVEILNAGADIFELGIPFSDPVADGSVIQSASQQVLANNVTINDVFDSAYKIKKTTNKPLILMGYANPLFNYGTKEFFRRAAESGVDGVIIPDIPLEEYNTFFPSDSNGIDKILLTTPATKSERIKEVDQKSEGFVYCVSVKGTTGGKNVFLDEVVQNVKNTYKQISRNKMLVGFGINSPQDIKKIKEHCDGVIVASAIMRMMQKENYKIDEVLNFVSELSAACNS
ncbi:MAG: tryptophan synthase subunit alpha [Rhodothermaceae bacterium]